MLSVRRLPARLYLPSLPKRSFDLMMSLSQRSSFARYGMAVVAVALITGLRQLLMPASGLIPPFNLYYLAVIIAGWYGGLRAGILATLLSSVVVLTLLHGSLLVVPFHLLDEIGRLGIFLIVGAFISLLNELRHRAQRRADEHALTTKVSQDTLRRSEERLQLAADSVDGIIYEWDLVTGRVERSRGLKDVLGYDPDTAPISLEWWRSRMHPDDLPRTLEDFNRALQNGGRFESEYRVLNSNDEYRHLLDHIRIVQNDRGEPERIVGCSIDITELIRGKEEREELLLREQQARATAEAFAIDNAQLLVAEQESRKMAEIAAARTARLQEITAAFSQALTTEQIAGVIVDRAIAGLGANAGFMMLIAPGGDHLEMCGAAGYSMETLERWRRIPLSASMLPTDAIRRHEAIWVESAAAMLAAYPNVARYPESGQFQARAIIPLIIDEQPVGVIGLVFAEVRSFEREEREFLVAFARQCAQALERARLYEAEREARTEAQRAGQELRKARDMAERANRAKDHFMAVLSHELRTPLTPVLTAVQALAEDPSISEEGRNLLDIVYRNVELEARLIDDLLDLTRIEKGKVELHPGEVDMHELIRTVLGLCRHDLAMRRLDIEMRLDAAGHHVHADAARMQQVLWNLVKNAVKFTPDGGRISIVTANHDGGLRVTVSDTGIGIEPDALPRIFDAFEQGDRRITRQFGGLGLGLAISRVLVQMHGGTLTAASDGSGQGATFTLDLETMVPRETTPAAPESDGGNIRILLVDDHRDTNRVVQLFLERQGYQVATAYTMTSALELASSTGFDLLISDIGLPDGSGLDLMRALNNREGLKAIALSGYGMEDDIRRSIEVGFAEHLIKPISPQKLQDAITLVLGS